MQPSVKAKLTSAGVWRDGDFWLGCVVFILGGWAFIEATGFDARSRVFPLTLSILIAVTGLVLIVRPLLSGPKPSGQYRKLGTMLAAAMVIGLWAMALKLGAGFMLGTLFMQIALLWLAGLRRWSWLVACALLITVLNYALFVVALDIRLPRSVFSFLLPGS